MWFVQYLKIKASYLFYVYSYFKNLLCNVCLHHRINLICGFILYYEVVNTFKNNEVSHILN